MLYQLCGIVTLDSDCKMQRRAQCVVVGIYGGAQLKELFGGRKVLAGIAGVVEWCAVVAVHSSDGCVEGEEMVEDYGVVMKD